MASANVDLELRKICVLRCVYSVLYSMAAQYLLLLLFLLFVNFSLLHPIRWLVGTFSLITSFSTWLCLMPLILVVIVHCVFLGKIHLAERTYYATCIGAIVMTAIPKSLFGLVHLSVGLLTSWLYTKFLNDNYRQLYQHCSSESSHLCLNEKYLFLLSNGLFTGLYYFLKNRIIRKTDVQFPIIQQSLYLEIRSKIFAIIYESLVQSCWPTIYFIVIYYVLGAIYRPADTEFQICDFRLIFYIWILSSQILTNMKLMDFLFNIFLTEPRTFSIESAVALPDQSEVLLVEALSATKFPLIKELASLDLYTLATSQAQAQRRTQIYDLSVPGGHPYNWKALSGQCLSLINLYRVELKKSVENVCANNNQPSYLKAMPYIRPPTTANDMAEKIRFRQFNESYGMRNMSMAASNEQLDQTKATKPDPCARFNELIGSTTTKIHQIRKSVLQTPGINYLFAEGECSKLCHLLTSDSQGIIWCVQGLSALAAHSLDEDRYGVVQNDLITIIKSFLELKQILDKISTINLGEQLYQQKLLALRTTVRRGLYKICNVFAEYLPDLVTDPGDLRSILNFINFKET